MYKRILVWVAGLSLGLLLTQSVALAYGYDFVFPGPRRSVISGYTSSDPPNHQAYDYRFGMHTKVAAAKGGTISSSRWDVLDGNETGCIGTYDDRGNHIILNHGSGLETWYFHLSNTGSQPGPGTVYALGQYIAYSGDTGCGQAHPYRLPRSKR
jgi:murein DD-endopeptidase MepM/ murein hydrolase activator NlpD